MFATMHITEQITTVLSESVGAVNMRWSAGMFSATTLSSLSIQYAAPWPVPAIISRKVLEKLTTITRRFLELGQLVALFRVVWGELRLKRVMTSRNQPAGRARPQKIDRHISDSMRLVQQTVQYLFDYLSERVYVYQARFKQSMHRASTYGLDAVVHALNAYSNSLCDAALQLSFEEITYLDRRNLSAEELPTPGTFTNMDPSLGLKTDINSMLECCRRILATAKSLGEAHLHATDTHDDLRFSTSLKSLKDNSERIQLYRESLVVAAKKVSSQGSINLDLQPLIMRFEM